MNSGNTASLLILLLPLLLLVVLVFSQRRRARAMVEFQASIGVGDEIVTTSGLYGRVVAEDGTIVSLEIARGVVVRLDRRAVGLRVADSASRPAAQ
ncbi:MAG: preprotein translocase subunit YajC [Dermatophilaceae bacterium]|nr:preprotein translocase subunit YajC [Intrasporangiaceae bacterium]